MAQSVLGSLTLGYRPLWNRARKLAGTRLFVHEDEQGVDGQHLLRTFGEQWTADSPPLVLCIRSRSLLRDVLSRADGAGPFIDVPVPWLSDSALRAVTRAARMRGAHLIASGSPQQAPDAEAARWFERPAVELSAGDAADALRAAMRIRQAAVERRITGRDKQSPISQDALVDGVASGALAEHALDQQGAWAVSGWPCEDILYRYQGRPMPPSNRAIVKVMNALDEEQSLERIEQLFGQEPTLAYRLLLYLNSAGLGLRNGIASLRHGFMMLGFNKVNAWLAEQLPGATDDANLQPVNAAMVLRAQLMDRLMDAGIEEDLRREVYLCGLFAQLDIVLDEPLKTSLSRIPMPDRIVQAVISRSGPYAPCLEVALALENPDPAPLRALRREHEMAPEEINRALLRTLALQTA